MRAKTLMHNDNRAPVRLMQNQLPTRWGVAPAAGLAAPPPGVARARAPARDPRKSRPPLPSRGVASHTRDGFGAQAENSSQGGLGSGGGFDLARRAAGRGYRA